MASGHGFVRDVDGEQFEGKVTFNDNLGIVTVENNEESRTFTSKKAIGFEFEDMELSRHRVFHVFNYDNKKTGFANLAFFEVLAEFKSFAVLAKIDPVEAKPKKGIMPRSANTMVGSSTTKVAFQKETIFVLNDRAEIEPYLELIEKETEGILVDTRSNRKKYVERDLLEQYIGALYPELKAFASDNDLRFDVKEDLIKILDHYKSLLGN
jgi:hypothetical protein